MGRPVIVVDDAIAHHREAFAELGELQPLPAALITPSGLARLRPSALITRSVTRVDAQLLDAAPDLRFVGTATAGTDHLDFDALAARDVAWANAAGCNARAVAEWMLAALTFIAPRVPEELLAGPFGVVGFGQVGHRVAGLMRTLGLEVLACDPPLARAGGHAEPFVDFAELWARCSMVSFHVPLTREGPDATFAYLDAQHPAPAGPKLIFNSSRGPVVRDSVFRRPDLAAIVLDVWDGEPELEVARFADPRLLLASPHVAGYSLEAKVRATRMMHEALAAHLGRRPCWTGAELLPRLPLDGPLEGYADPAAALTRIVDLPGDDARVRALAGLPPQQRAPAFESLRREYRLRREFAAWEVDARRLRHPELGDWLRLFGFELSD